MVPFAENSSKELPTTFLSPMVESLSSSYRPISNLTPSLLPRPPWLPGHHILLVFLLSCGLLLSPLFYFPFPSIPSCRRVCSFSVAAITNYHKHGGLDNINTLSYSSGDQKSKMGLSELPSRCQQCCTPLWRLQGDSTPCLFQLLKVDLCLWLLGPFL